jgi:hypothetical protein
MEGAMTAAMLLIDADNVSLDVIEQALEQLPREFGGVGLRRAYCTPETAVKHQASFKRLQIRPMVNLAAGKNSTDIALAIDAVELVTAERPDVVVIASSDSDFAPLVARLRELGCRVVGIGQKGKVGDETRAVYDDFREIEHRSAAAKTAARKAAPKRRAGAAADKPEPKREAGPMLHEPRREAKAALHEPRRKLEPALPDKVLAVLAALPELARGETVELRVAAERLRDAGLLTKSGSSTRFFAPFAERFELIPEKGPNRVRLRGR